MKKQARVHQMGPKSKPRRKSRNIPKPPGVGKHIITPWNDPIFLHYCVNAFYRYLEITFPGELPPPSEQPEIDADFIEPGVVIRKKPKGDRPC